MDNCSIRAMTESLFEEKIKKKKWWSRWEVIAIIFLLACCVGLGGYIYRKYYQKRDNVCVTQSCLEAALHLVSSMDDTVDPCEDFYQFTCGNFIKKAYEHNIPRLDYVQEIKRDNQLNALIAEPITEDEWKPLLLQKQFFQSCMNETSIDDDENETIMNLIEGIGGWPVLQGGDWNEEDYDLAKIMVACYDLGLPFETFFKFSFEADENDTLVMLDIPDLEKPFEDSFKEAMYMNLMVETAVNLGASRTLAVNELGRTLQFEKRLFKAINNWFKNHHQEEEVINSETLRFFTRTDLTFFIRNISSDFFPTAENVTVKASTEYLIKLNSLFAEFSKRTQANFFVWKTIQSFGPYLSPPSLRETFGNFSNFMLLKSDQALSRSEICLKEAKEKFKNIAEKAYIKKYANDEIVESVKVLISSIKNTFVSRIDEADWIDKSTKKTAIDKIQFMIEIFGDHRLDFDDDVEAKFLGISDLDFNSSNIIEKITKNNFEKFYLKLAMADVPSIDPLSEKIFEEALELYHTYIEESNVIEISAATMQPYYYSADRPNYLNFASFGILLAFTMANSLKIEAFSSDSDAERAAMKTWFNESIRDLGNTSFGENPLWNDQIKEELYERSQCIIDQYDNYEEEADFEILFCLSLSVDTAYEAYLSWANGKAEEELPGLPYSPSQLFWIYYGSQICNADVATNDWHSPDESLQSIKPLMNSRNFAKDFKCASGSAMNPQEKCGII